ncbi:hypothetical protein V6Z12_A09G219000 [Gossypium hirsutum]
MYHIVFFTYTLLKTLQTYYQRHEPNFQNEPKQFQGFWFCVTHYQSLENKQNVKLYIQKNNNWMLVNPPIHFIYKLSVHYIISKLQKNTSQMNTNTRLKNNILMNISRAAMIRCTSEHDLFGSKTLTRAHLTGHSCDFTGWEFQFSIV